MLGEGYVGRSVRTWDFDGDDEDGIAVGERKLETTCDQETALIEGDTQVGEGIEEKAE